MKGDFTRNTFDHTKHYSSVRMQQGRVQLDADWNEKCDIEAHLKQTTTGDVIGLCGAPMQQAGFSIQSGSPPADNLLIGAGRYYVDGILCENEADVLFTEQPDFPGAVIPPQEGSPPEGGPGQYLAYLDVWQRHITALEDPDIREVALGGPDTATRTKTVWQVKLVRVGELGEALHCLSEPATWQAAIAPSTGAMRARSQPSETDAEPCIVPAGAGFRRLENQLYRIEIHRDGALGTATFKWSRDNGSIVVPWLTKNGNDLTLSSPGRDAIRGFANGQWVELTDDTHELHGEPGTLVQLTNAEGQVLTIDPATATGPVEWVNFPSNPKVRRWDMADGEIAVSLPATNDGWIPLEDGVEVQFQAGTYRTGDYWLIPARTVTGDIEWPRDAVNLPQTQLPHGIHHHYCRLALLRFDGTAWTVQSDCRSLFPPVTELTSLFYVSGDGQEVTPDPTQPNQQVPLAQPLQVGVANGSQPVPGATIYFTVIGGNGSVAPAQVVTAANGIASCIWSLDSTTQSQQVEATLRDAAGNTVHMPVRFTANLSQASEVAYNPATCPDLAAAGARTVQQAIDELCERLPQPEPGIGILEVRSLDGALLPNDVLVPVSRLAAGLRILCDAPLSQESGGGVPLEPPSSYGPDTVPAKPTCVVTLDLPYPIGADNNFWDVNTIVGFQPLILGSTVTVRQNVMLWNPTTATRTWLQQLLFQRLNAQEVTDRLLAHLTIKGNVFWRGDMGGEPTIYLDGEGFGRPGANGRIDLRFPTGDGRRGGDLEMWFWLMPAATPGLVLDVSVTSIPLGSTVIRSIIGSVTDTAGNAVPNATVTLTAAGSVTRTTTTNTQGQFGFGSVAPGTYVVTAQLNNQSAESEVVIPGQFAPNITVLNPATFAGRTVDEVDGIGPVFRARLEANGITSPVDVATMESANLAPILGVSETQATAIIQAARRLLQERGP